MPDQETIDAYKKLLASAPQGERQYLGIVIRHPLITAPYFFVADNANLIATDELGQVQTFNQSSLTVDLDKQSDDLDQGGQFTLRVDTRNLKSELERIPIDSQELPQLNFLVWVSGHLDDPIEVYRFHVAEISWEKGMATFKAVSPQLDLSQSGLRYTLQDYPVLRGAL